jgi:hypothetical protein
VRSNSELSAQLKALRNSLNSELSPDPSPPPDEPAVAASHSALSSVREKDLQIDSLRLELAELEVRLAEESNSAVIRARKAEEALLQVKLENIRLVENVESYQLLLQDRTLKGEYSILTLEDRIPDVGSESGSIRSTSPFHESLNSKPSSLATELAAVETIGDDSTIKGVSSR